MIREITFVIIVKKYSKMCIKFDAHLTLHLHQVIDN